MEFKSQAYKVLSNSHAMEIMINETFEEVTYRYSGDSEMYTTSIDYDMEGEAYFTEYRGPYEPAIQYLNEFMRISR
jgi:hypothetical protein